MRQPMPAAKFGHQLSLGFFKLGNAQDLAAERAIAALSLALRRRHYFGVNFSSFEVGGVLSVTEPPPLSVRT